MTEGVLSDDSLKLLAPDRVSPGLLALLDDDAPMRAILCAGAGHFAAAHVMLTEGYTPATTGDAAADEVAAHWADVTYRQDAVVLGYGFAQAERELASQGHRAPAVAPAR